MGNAAKGPDRFALIVFLQLVASDLSGSLLDQVLDTCSSRILEVHGDTLTKLYPVTRLHDLLPLVKVKNQIW